MDSYYVIPEECIEEIFLHLSYPTILELCKLNRYFYRRFFVNVCLKKLSKDLESEIDKDIFHHFKFSDSGVTMIKVYDNTIDLYNESKRIGFGIDLNNIKREAIKNKQMRVIYLFGDEIKLKTICNLCIEKDPESFYSYFERYQSKYNNRREFVFQQNGKLLFVGAMIASKRWYMLEWFYEKLTSRLFQNYNSGLITYFLLALLSKGEKDIASTYFSKLYETEADSAVVDGRIYNHKQIEKCIRNGSLRKAERDTEYKYILYYNWEYYIWN